VARLLDRGGFVLADAFVTDAPKGHRGYRGMVRISEAHLGRLFAEAGLSARELFTTPARRCRRVMYRLGARRRMSVLAKSQADEIHTQWAEPHEV